MDGIHIRHLTSHTGSRNKKRERERTAPVHDNYRYYQYKINLGCLLFHTDILEQLPTSELVLNEKQGVR